MFMIFFFFVLTSNLFCCGDQTWAELELKNMFIYSLKNIHNVESALEMYNLSIQYNIKKDINYDFF